MAQALSLYLEQSKNEKSKIIETLFIDSCTMKDKEFFNILNGIKS